jgi:hypothetical protein
MRTVLYGLRVNRHLFPIGGPYNEAGPTGPQGPPGRAALTQAHPGDPQGEENRGGVLSVSTHKKFSILRFDFP